METRTIWSKVTFRQEFSLPGSDAVFPPGEYDLLTEEERLQGLSFDAYRRSRAFLEVAPDPRFPARTELCLVTEADLHQARGHAAVVMEGSICHRVPSSLPPKETP